MGRGGQPLLCVTRVAGSTSFRLPIEQYGLFPADVAVKKSFWYGSSSFTGTLHSALAILRVIRVPHGGRVFF